jgi:hypothetical protein
MACLVSNGRLEQCKDSISGIQAVYLINFGDFDPDPTTGGGDVGYNETTISLTTGGTGYTTGTAVATTGGSGTGFTVNITAAAGVITAITVNNDGSLYQAGDVLTVTGGTGGTFTITNYGTVGYEDMITSIGGSINNIYKYELKGNNGFIQTMNTSRENGTTFFTQTITVELKRQDPVFHKQFKILAYGRPHVVVRTNGNQFFLAGLFRGCDATAGSVESGVQYGDFNGYKITFEAMEEKPANFLDCSTEQQLLTLLGAPTLVTT